MRSTVVAQLRGCSPACAMDVGSWLVGVRRSSHGSRPRLRVLGETPFAGEADCFGSVCDSEPSVELVEHVVGRSF